MRKPKAHKSPRKTPKHVKRKAKKGQRSVTSLVTKGHEPKCACCSTMEYLTFDHIIPRSKGGPDTTENGQILCKHCNNIKGDRIISIEELKIEVDARNADRAKNELKIKASRL